MSNQHITGYPDIVQIPVKLTSTVPTNTISPGDLIAQVSGYAVAAPAFTWTTDLATTQAAFALAFAGVSSGRSRAASTDTRDLLIPVHQDGVDQMDCDSAVYTFGQYLGPRKNASANTMDNVLAAVATLSLATHVSMETTVSAVTTIKARVVNTYGRK